MLRKKKLKKDLVVSFSFLIFVLLKKNKNIMNLQEIGYIFWTNGSATAETFPIYIAPEQTIATAEGVWRVEQTISSKRAHLFMDESEIDFYSDVDIWVLCVPYDAPVRDWIKPHIRNLKLNDLI